MLRTSLFVAFFTLAASGFAQDPAVQRIPRQAAPTTGAVEGIVRAETGLGVAGAHVVLRGPNQGFEKETTGDGVFLIPDVPPGDYELSIERATFEPIHQQVHVVAGEPAQLELTMKAAPVEPLSIGNPVRNPELGARPQTVTPEPEVLSPYRNFPPMASNEPIGNEPQPLEPLASDEDIFTPVPNRWREDYPDYKRYNMGGDVQYVKGHWYDPFNRNKLKGDFPIIGNRTFLSFLLASNTFLDGRRIPLPSNLDATRPNTSNFFGRFGQFFMFENMTFSATLFHGDTSFRPVDWQIRVTPEINLNYLAVKENGIVNINPAIGTTRFDEHTGLQEGFFEYKLKDLTSEYDFISIRAGIQHFNSDFRGFIFNDEEPGVRIFGNFGSNRYQYNVAAFAMLEKDTNSGLNSFEYRHQNVFIANVYRQDFFFKGYTIQASFHYDKDDPSFRFNSNDFLVRPAPIGNVQPHSIRAYYYGLTGDGHIGRINVDHAFYQVLGTDKDNEIMNNALMPRRRVGINGQMAALELSLDKDWIRYRISGFYSSGEADPNYKGTAHGFDAIFDNPNFVGGIFSFWNREGIRLLDTGVVLEDGNSLIPSLRSSKIQGQAEFANPGIMIANAGADVDVSPKLRAFANLNLIRFVHTGTLEDLLFQGNVHHGVGADSGIGINYRPPLTDNIVIVAGFNAFFPFQGFRDILASRTLYSLFTNVRFQF